jgi:C4-dicarboxylate transporter DctM subunit
MSPEMFGVLVLLFLFVLMFGGVPIGVAMAVAGFAGFAVISGFDAALGMLKSVPFTTVASYMMSVIPLFLLMGQFASFSKIIEDAYYATYKWLGHLPGGVAIATIGGCSGFAAVCGSSLATAGAMTPVALPEMIRYKYDSKLATGSIAAGGTLGILIPPSTPFMVYGVIAEQSVGRLFIAGILPGILLSAMFIATIWILTAQQPLLGPRGPRFGWRERLIALKNIWPMATLIILVMGGIWGGFFSPTEAGGMGAAGALLVALGRRQFTWQRLFSSLRVAVGISGMIFTMLIGAMIFNYFLAVSRLAGALASFVGGLPLPPMGIVVAILAIYLFLGCIMDTLAMVVLTLPIFLPVLRSLGIDLIWFGVILTIMTEMALITPPVGMNVFVVAGAAKDVPMYDVFRGILPFLITMVLCEAIIVIFPQISLFLPNTMLGGG